MNKHDIVFAFDVSTSATGYCLLMDDKPMKYGGNITIGQLPMIATEAYKGYDAQRRPVKKQRPIKYGNYGDKLFHGANDALVKIENMIYQVLKPINDIITWQKKSKKYKGEPLEIKSFKIIFEVSEIPNFGRYNFQSISSVRKLALFVGAVTQVVSGAAHAFAFNFAHKAEVKFIKPTEWQERLWSKRGDREATKLKSIEEANKWLKKKGLSTLSGLKFNDTADAINIARVASEVRDNVLAKAQSKGTTTNKARLKNKLLNIERKIAEYLTKAAQKKIIFLNNVIWAHSIKKDSLKGSLITKYNKFSKYTFQDAKIIDDSLLLSPKEQRMLAKFKNDKIELENELSILNSKKILK